MKTRIEKLLENKSKYCYANGVLINKLGITDKNELEEAEATFTYLRLCKLHSMENSFKFDPDYYLSIHKYIFQDIYDFAGEIRNENITKGSTPFCNPLYVYEYLKGLLEELRRKVKNIETMDDYIKILSCYYCEINMAHPFREGNGRTQREYFRQLVEYLNDHLPLPPMYLDYSNISDEDRNNLIQGCINGANEKDYTLLQSFFRNILKEKDKERQFK